MTIQKQRLDQFILDLHDASMYLSSQDFQQWTLKEVRRYIDFDFAIWGAGDGRHRQLHHATILDQVNTLFNTWEPVKHIDPFANLVIGNTGQTWTTESVTNFKESIAFRQHWGQYHAQQMMSTMEVDQKTGLHVFVTLARDQEKHRYTKEECVLKNIITQHIFLAARHNDLHHLRALRTPAALMDRGGILNAALTDFRALVVQEWGRWAEHKLPKHVTQSLWQTGSYRGRHIVLNAQTFNNRLLVRAGIAPQVHLSTREHEVAWAYVSGHTHKEVAKLLEISPTTVRTHLARVYQKLEITDKASLAFWLRENTNN
ncbi:MAG: helix-turn-helix transcriptional regulator [Aliidiomarina sp.]|uniref:helix-turn-helix transcriptional regulator n=1 Tax=Aliidiomarina sp. TaxID=1872439 RepID=UPI0025C25090|nr:helix-turn-helix transcriptional regulator [Aliidiomarina sp.]MCH8501737.1 helix-turn-helix transcriptional regulator [Aliidiomarina sp.]